MPCAEIRCGDFCSPHPACGHVDSLAPARSARCGLSAPPNSFRHFPNGSSLPSAEKENHPACGSPHPSLRANLSHPLGEGHCPGQTPRRFHLPPVPVFYSERHFSYPIFPTGVMGRCYARVPGPATIFKRKREWRAMAQPVPNFFHSVPPTRHRRLSSDHTGRSDSNGHILTRFS